MGTATVGSLVTILRTVCRNAGISDADGTTYDLTTKHLAIQALLEDFLRRTRCNPQVDSFTLSTDSATADLHALTGFHTERIFRIWIDGQNDPLRVVPIEQVNDLLADDSSSQQHVRVIGFDSTTGTGKVWPTPSADYTGKVQWWPPLITWTLGDTQSATTNTIINMPGDLARAVVYAGGIYFMQKNQPEHADIIAASRAEYEQLVARSMGTGGLGIHELRRGEDGTRERPTTWGQWRRWNRFGIC